MVSNIRSQDDIKEKVKNMSKKERINQLVELMAKCQKETAELHLNLIHYFLDMAIVELRDHHLPFMEKPHEANL